MPPTRAIIRFGTLKLKDQRPDHVPTAKTDAEPYDWYINICSLHENTDAFGALPMWIDMVYWHVRCHSAAQGPPNRSRSENVTIAYILGARVWSARRECFYNVNGFADCHNHSKFETLFDLNQLDPDSSLPELQKLDIKFLYVSGPKINKYGSLEFNLPHAILELDACARCLEKDIIRGVLTNGRQWIFIILRLNNTGLGGAYSDEFNLLDPVSKEPSRGASESLIYILTHWAHHPHDEI